MRTPLSRPIIPRPQYRPVSPVRILNPKPATASTGEKPQSKVWNYDGSWYAVFPTSASGASSAGTWVWKLVGTTWTEVVKISTRTDTHADVLVDGSVAHILLWQDTNTQLSSIEYVSGAYQLWSTRNTLVSISLPGSETATIALDTTDRMWLATRTSAGEIVVYHSPSPYSTWSGPIVLETGVIGSDDISVITALPNGTVGVFWGNENASVRRFGFRYHVDGAAAGTWSVNEVPASQSAVDGIGTGMADDHMNVAVASDSTLYVAIKTSYDTTGYPRMALLVRRPNGTWDNIYPIDEAGTRPIILLDEVHGFLSFIYTSSEGYNPIVYQQSSTASIAFDGRKTLRSSSFNDVSSMKGNYDTGFVVIYSSASEVGGQYCSASGATGADLSISKTDGQVTVRPNDPIAYTITAINSGPQSVTGATVADTIPADLTGVSWSCAGSGGGTCPASGTGNINNTVNLPVGASVTFTVTATVANSATGSLVNTATITPPGGVTDPALTNNSATDTDVITILTTSCETDSSLVGCWQMEENGGSALLDGSSYTNDAALYGSPAWAAGKVGSYSLDLNGTSQYGLVADDSSLDITNQITIATWIKPEQYATMDLIKKATNGSVDGYELTLATTKTDATSQRVFFRINQATNADTYRVSAITEYPIDGTWMHAAATYDGTTMRLYINGVLESSLTPPGGTTIALNNVPVSIGAQNDVQRFYMGWMDDARIYNRALSLAEIQVLAGVSANNAPVITESDPQAVTMSEDGSPTAFSKTLNATDADGNTLTWSISGAATHGTATASGTGVSKVIGYTPTADYNGSDSFVVQVSDGSLTDTITVNVTISAVNDAPVITESDPQAVTMSEDGSPTAFSKTLNATDVDNATLTWSISGAATHGTATASGTGVSKVIGYTPTADYNGSDSFVVQVSDGSLTDTITVNVTINAVNDAPVITESDPQAVTMSEDGSPIAFSKTLNATDVDSATLTWSISGAATHGTATASGTGVSKAIGYIPTADYNGSDTFVVQITDGSLTDTITVNVTINAVNDAPVITEGTSIPVSMSENGTPTAFALTLNATDVDSTTLTWSISGAATHGTATASGTGASKVIGYIPTADYNGSDSFVVQVSDGSLIDTITVNVTIGGANNPPVITETDPQPVYMDEDGSPNPFALTLHATDADAGDTLTWSILTAALHGTASASGTGTSKVIGYTPTANYFGSDSFVVQVSDGIATDTITINVNIYSVFDTPVITGQVPLSTNMDTELTIYVTDITIVDPDNTYPTDFYLMVLDGTNYTHVGATITPVLGFTGVLTVPVAVNDGNSTSDPYNLSVTVNSVNTFTLSVSKSGTGTGTVTSSPPGIDCGSDCNQAYNDGTIVTLTATPTAGGYDRFIGWSGAGCSGIGTCFATMDAAKTVTAEFQKTTFSDVPFTHPNWAYIQALWDNGFTAGCQATGEPLKFCPEQTMLRAELAVFMLRGKLGAIGTPTDAEPYVFGDDWTSIEWAIPWAEKMWDEGMTAGCQYPAGADPKLFCPYTLFTRDMGAVFALRIKHGSDMPVPVGTGQVFADMTDLVSSDGIGVGWAEQAYAEGLIPDCGIDPVSTKPKFCPLDQLDRSWSAYMIVKAKGMTLPE